MTRESFIEWLKEKDFYDAWIEGYNLDNDLYNDAVPLDKFFKDISDYNWFYTGISALAMNPDSGWDEVLKEAKKIGEHEKWKDIQNRWTRWRESNLSSLEELDKEWIKICKDENT